MRRLDRRQIVRFLRTVDDALENDVTVFVIGGAAAILRYGAAVKTADLDVPEVISGSASDFAQAVRVARELKEDNLSIDPASIAQLPYNYFQRLKPVRGLRLRKLTLLVPDKYDLVLSKTLRAYEHDLEAIASMHAKHPLSEKTLVARFEDEMRNEVVGNRRNFEINMTFVVDLLYGKERAEFYRKRWSLD